MNLNNFTQGILILSNYYNDSDGYHIAAEHDIFYMYPTDNPLEKQDVQKMVDYGWLQEDTDTGEDDEYNAKHYDLEASWCAYT